MSSEPTAISAVRSRGSRSRRNRRPPGRRRGSRCGRGRPGRSASAGLTVRQVARLPADSSKLADRSIGFSAAMPGDAGDRERPTTCHDGDRRERRRRWSAARASATAAARCARELVEHRGRLVAEVGDRARPRRCAVGVLVGQAAKVDLQGAEVRQRRQGQSRLEPRVGRLGRGDQARGSPARSRAPPRRQSRGCGPRPPGRSSRREWPRTHRLVASRLAFVP